MQADRTAVRTASSRASTPSDPALFARSTGPIARPSRDVADALKAAVAPQVHLPADALKFGATIESNGGGLPVAEAADEEAQVGSSAPQAALQAHRLSSALQRGGNLKEVSNPLRWLRGETASLHKEFARFQREMNALLQGIPDDIAAPIRARLGQLHDAQDLRVHQTELLESFSTALHRLDEAEAGGERSRTARALSQGRRLGEGAGQLAANPWIRFTLLAGAGTVLKTFAWFGGTLIPDSKLGGPNTSERTLTEIHSLIGWLGALTEYPFMVGAGRVAEKAGIQQTDARPIIELEDLLAFLGFEAFVKKQSLSATQIAGAGASTLGVVSMNPPAMVTKALGRAARALHLPGSRNTASAQRPLNAREIASKSAEMQEMVKRIDGPVRQKIEQLQNGLQQVLNGNIDVDLDHVPPTTRPSARLLAAGRSLEDLRPALASAQALATTARELSDAMHVGQAGMGGLLSGTTHWSRNQQKYLYLGMAAVIQTGALVGAFKLDDPKAKAALFSLVATGLKTFAWYLHTLIPDEKLLSARISPERARLRGTAQLAEKIGLSWLIAGTEYHALIPAIRTTDQNGINLASIRGAIAFADLLWLAAFMKMFKGEKLGMRHAVALAWAGLGVTLANLPTGGKGGH